MSKTGDLKTRKILGYGTVYGSGTPTAGLLTTGAGADKTGGKWLFDKTSQGGYFSSLRSLRLQEAGFCAFVTTWSS